MKRTALLVALLALSGCLTECGAVGHGVIGRGVASGGAVGGGGVGGSPGGVGVVVPEPTAWYAFEDDATDSTGGFNDGSAVNVTYVTGKVGKAASFNGSTSYVDVTVNTTANWQGKTAYSVDVWIYPNSDGEGSSGRIFDKTQGSGGPILFLNNESGGACSYGLNWSGFATQNLRFYAGGAYRPITIGAWNHVALVMENSTGTNATATLYINGAEVDSYSVSDAGLGAAPDDTSYDLVIGSNYTQTLTFDGLIDELRFYENVSLTADQVQARYAESL